MKFLTSILVFLIIYQSYAQQRESASPNRYRFSYKSNTYKGTRVEITTQLRTLKNNSWFINIPKEKQTVLNTLFKKVKEQPIPRLYRKRAIIFLDALYAYEKFLILYDNAVYEVIQNLKQDMRRLDFKFERQYTKAKRILDRTQKEDKNNVQKIGFLQKELHDSQIKLVSHRWMKKIIERYNGMDAVKKPDKFITEFKKIEAMNVFIMIEEKEIDKINSYLENQIIDFFYKKSIPEIDPDKLELDYIDKI
ncbi:hypothetical protein [Aquimarina longa]|uniref:hypothetical protein n=1 Tax=Aquimarina longa TaxID=1080221 RepID=UPI0007816A6E|nr:hypothetical protein [Aquimarina longa]